MKQTIVIFLTIGLILGAVLVSSIPMGSAISPQPQPPMTYKFIMKNPQPEPLMTYKFIRPRPEPP